MQSKPRCNSCMFYSKRHCNKKLCEKSPRNNACDKYKPVKEPKND